jgi:hypothetical protein
MTQLKSPRSTDTTDEEAARAAQLKRFNDFFATGLPVGLRRYAGPALRAAAQATLGTPAVRRTFLLPAVLVGCIIAATLAMAYATVYAVTGYAAAGMIAALAVLVLVTAPLVVLGLVVRRYWRKY